MTRAEGVSQTVSRAPRGITSGNGCDAETKTPVGIERKRSGSGREAEEGNGAFPAPIKIGGRKRTSGFQGGDGGFLVELVAVEGLLDSPGGAAAATAQGDGEEPTAFGW